MDRSAADAKSAPRRIVFVVNHAAFFASHRLPIAVEAQRRGDHVTLLTGQAGSESMEPAAEKAVAANGIAHIRVAFTSAGLNPYVELKGFLGLVRELRRIRPDLVHCASPKGILYGATAARLTGVRGVVLAISGMGFAFGSSPRRSFMRSAIAAAYRHVVRFAYGHRNKRVIVQNRDDEQLVIDAGLARADEMLRIPGSGVDLQRIHATPAGEKQPLVLFPARMIVDKGVHEFIAAAQIVRQRLPQWRFVMAGAADYQNPTNVSRATLEKFQAEGTIEWLGHVEDMTPLFEQAGIVCLPSYYREGMPKALLEAAAAGCAVITTDSTGCREAIVPGVTGDLVPPRDSRILAEALTKLIEDGPRRERYGRAGRKLAEEQFGIDTVVGRILHLYEDLLRNA